MTSSKAEGPPAPSGRSRCIECNGLKKRIFLAVIASLSVPYLSGERVYAAASEISLLGRIIAFDS
jgi:hypothetical protein